MNVLDYIGMYGIFGVNAYGMFQLRDDPYVAVVFILFIGINEILNRVLKTTIREERPIELISDDKTNTAYYGMPSGHSQHVFFSAMFLQLQGVPFIEWVWIVPLITMYERAANKKHTIKQVVVGALVGLGVGALANEITKLRIKAGDII